MGPFHEAMLWFMAMGAHIRNCHFTSAACEHETGNSLVVKVDIYSKRDETLTEYLNNHWVTTR